jgi:hypothetical protein
LCVEAKELVAPARSCDILRGKSQPVFSLLPGNHTTLQRRGVFNLFGKGVTTWQNVTTETVYSAATTATATRRAAITPTLIAARRARATAAGLAARLGLQAAAKSATAQAAK